MDDVCQYTKMMMKDARNKTFHDVLHLIHTFVSSLKLTDIAPENRGPLEKEIPIGNHHFQGIC